MRRLLAAVLGLLAVLVTTVGVSAIWGRNQILDTDRFLESVTPLAEDPAIQDDLADKVADVIADKIEEAAPRLPDVRSIVSLQAHAFMRSDAFVQAWVGLNRVGHEQLVKVLTDEDGTIELDLDSIVAAVREQVAEAGLEIVASLPHINLVVDVAEVDGIDTARSGVNVLDKVANVLPFAALLLLGLTIAAARRRWRAGAILAGAITVVSLLFTAGVFLGAQVASAKVPESVASEDAVHAYYGHLTALLRNGYLTLAVVAAVLWVGCLVINRRRTA